MFFLIFPPRSHEARDAPKTTHEVDPLDHCWPSTFFPVPREFLCTAAPLKVDSLPSAALTWHFGASQALPSPGNFFWPFHF